MVKTIRTDIEGVVSTSADLLPYGKYRIVESEAPDTVTLEGLEVGTQYKLVGWQMLKEENAELLINGKHVESNYTFTADSETMKVEVSVTFDATFLDGKQLVIFEDP